MSTMGGPVPASAKFTVDETLDALRRSRERLDKLLAPLSAEELAAGSYASEWSIAQVASHLGSGAEIFGLIVDAGARDADVPGREAFADVWARWNAKDPTAQSRDALESIANFVAGVDALTTQQRDRWQIEVFGQHFDLAGLLVMRLAEHVVHAWDIAVVSDATAVLPDDDVPFIIDNLARVVSRSGRPVAQPALIRVVTTGPQRRFDLRFDGESAVLEPAGAAQADGTAQLSTPAEAFIRLVYGRLDADHTPDSVRTHGIDLDTLRGVFPGL
jgi:uncharacterized protein (TIGR03083 family)